MTISKTNCKEKWQRKYFEKSETDNKTQDNYQLSDDEYIELLKKHPGGITQKIYSMQLKKEITSSIIF